MHVAKSFPYYLNLNFSVLGLYVLLVPSSIRANEVDGEVFVCVEASPGGPVLQERTIRIGTQDGSAIGRVTSNVLCNQHSNGTTLGDVLL